MRVIETLDTKLKGATKVKARARRALGEDGGGSSKGRLSHSRGVSFAISQCRRAQSTDAGTRKMVNYAWSGRSQGKP